MKREILCDECNNSCMIGMKGVKWRNTPGENVTMQKEGMGESEKSIRGEALITCTCDACGMKIEKGANCWAYSNWITNSKQHGYYEWEHDYINLAKDEQW
jgi:hypothetical protein